MKPVARPVYLNLFRIHLPLAGWVSILHRASGALLFLALPLGIWMLSISLTDEAGFRRLADWLALPLCKLVLLLLIAAFAQHLFAGLRHLAMDAYWGVSLQHARQSSLVVILATVAVTAFAAWRLFA